MNRFVSMEISLSADFNMYKELYDLLTPKFETVSFPNPENLEETLTAQSLVRGPQAELAGRSNATVAWANCPEAEDAFLAIVKAGQATVTSNFPVRFIPDNDTFIQLTPENLATADLSTMIVSFPNPENLEERLAGDAKTLYEEE